MAAINMTSVKPTKPIAPARDAISIEVLFDVVTPLEEDVEMRMFFIWSTKNEKLDQELDTCDVGPLDSAGVRRFTMMGSTPDFFALPRKSQLDVCAIYVSAIYKNKEFCRVGYYVKHEYLGLTEDEEPPTVLDIDRIERVIDVRNPLITHWDNSWDGPDKEEYPPEEDEEVNDDIVCFSPVNKKARIDEEKKPPNAAPV
eukprot:GEMP01052308.1.p1 GENE.GEMP01052308.1~~GEMP01052308.1.p1  ORF type:complete len:199 (+),score=33.28 GEMP01052308.1:95-691(+)